MKLSATSLAVALAAMGQASVFDAEQAFEKACDQAEISAAQSVALRSEDAEGLRSVAGLDLVRRTNSTVKAYQSYS